MWLVNHNFWNDIVNWSAAILVAAYGDWAFRGASYIGKYCADPYTSCRGMY